MKTNTANAGANAIRQQFIRRLSRVKRKMIQTDSSPFAVSLLSNEILWLKSSAKRANQRKGGLGKI